MSYTIDKDGIANQDELTFQIDDFRQPKVLTDFDAVAKRLQNLILMRKGTMPNDFDMGVDINSYRFEYRNSDTENMIRSEINNQIDKYLPDIPVKNFEIVFKNQEQSTAIYIGFSFIKDFGNKNVILQFDVSTATGNKSQVVSEIYIV